MSSVTVDTPIPLKTKEHILAALKEQLHHWEKLLEGLNEEQLTIPRLDGNWSVKDVMAHLWGWQQISIARLEAAVFNREPELPKWTSELTEDWEEDVDQANAWICETQHPKSWSEIYQSWREGFLKLLDLAASIPEKDLLDGSRYWWLKGYSLAFVLVASYDHHQEHLERLIAALQQ
jgi:hypothetical protein